MNQESQKVQTLPIEFLYDLTSFLENHGLKKNSLVHQELHSIIIHYLRSHGFFDYGKDR